MERKSSDARIRANTKYDKANVVQMSLKLNKKTDADILEVLNQQESKLGYIKMCIREQMKRDK